MIDFQFGASQYLQIGSFGLSFGLVALFTVCVILCIGSSFMPLFQFDIWVSSILLFLFFRLYVFCCICSTTFGTSKSFASSYLSHNFLSVFDVKNFNFSVSVLNSEKWPSFSNSNNFSQWSCGGSVSVCFAQKISSFVVFVSFR